jgi:TonB family protein
VESEKGRLISNLHSVLTGIWPKLFFVGVLGLAAATTKPVEYLWAQEPTTKPPRALSAPPPIPPSKTTKQRKVVLSFVVTEQGTVRDITVVKHFKPDFDSAAIEAVRKWTFEPATKDGKPLAIRVETEIVFHPK